MLDASVEFQRREILFVRKKDIHKVMDLPGFVSVVQYACAVPLEHEIGCVGKKRFVSRQLNRWTP